MDSRIDSRNLRIVFAGTPQFAAEHLLALISQGFNIVSAYSQPDRPTGRGKIVLPTPVKALALEHGIEVHQPNSLNDPEQVQILAALKPDVMVVVAYGLLLPEPVLALPEFGCINVHPSLLPRWRGAAPIERALLTGDAETGVCIMQMDKGLDSGPVLKKITTPIQPQDNSMTLGNKLCALGCEALCDALQNLPVLIQNAVAQDEQCVSYAKKITKAEALIDWNQAAATIHNLARAMYPRSPAFCFIEQKRLRIIETTVLTETTTAKAGSIYRCSNDSIDVACGMGGLRITRVQQEGKNEMAIASLLNGHPDYFSVGMQLGQN